MGRFIFNPFTQNFTVIPKPPKQGVYEFTARNGKLEWVKREVVKKLNLNFTSEAVPFVSSVGILPRVVFYRGDGDYAGSVSDAGVYTPEFVIDPAVSDESFYVVGLYVSPDQGAAVNMLPTVAVSVSPVADSSGSNVAFLWTMEFTTDAAVSVQAFDL